MNAPHEEAAEFSKISKRENRVYVGNLSYDVKYRDLMEFMRGGGWGHIRSHRFGVGMFSRSLARRRRRHGVDWSSRWRGFGCIGLGEVIVEDEGQGPQSCEFGGQRIGGGS
jgi:hypothetical protein